MTNVAISLLSGGLDSTIVTSYALKYANDLTAITFDYGQSHGREINSAKNITSLLNVKHKLIELPFFKQSAWYSALTNPDTFPISKSTHDREIGKKIPLTYVPLRNTIFLSIAAGLLESIILKKIELGKSDITDITASIYLGPNIVDFSGYPDCKPEFFSQISETIRMGSKLGTQYGIEIEIQTPLLHMSKSEIVRLGMELGSPISSTWSCYIGKELPCHLCESCQLRARGFSEAGIVDPSL